MEVFSRIRQVARERFLEANAERICSNLFSMLKHHSLGQLFAKWRVRSYTDAVREMTYRQEELEDTKLKHRHEREVMEAHKQAKAAKIIRQKKQREVANAWINTTKVLKSLRVKEETL
jgi:uncharacterized protein (DUF39 family)